MADTCEKCRFMVRTKGNVKCVRFPPVVILGEWHYTGVYGGLVACGEFSTVCEACKGTGGFLDGGIEGWSTPRTCKPCRGSGWRTAARTPPGGAGGGTPTKDSEG